MNKKTIVLIIFIIALAVLAAVLFPLIRMGPSLTDESSVNSWKEAKALSTDVKFLGYIAMGLPEQDVFVEHPTDKTKVIRIEGAEAKKNNDAGKDALCRSYRRSA